MRRYEVPLELIRLNAASDASQLSSRTLVEAHRFVDALTDEELLEPVEHESPIAHLRSHPQEQAEVYLSELCDVEPTSRVEKMDARGFDEGGTPHCAVPFALAADGRTGQARELMEFLCRRGVSSAPSQRETFDDYADEQERLDWPRDDDEPSIRLTGPRVPSDREMRVLGEFIRFLDTDATARFEIGQAEVPVGVSRVADCFDTTETVDLDKGVRAVWATNDRGVPEGFHTMGDIAGEYGSRYASGAASVDFVATGETHTYVVEIKTGAESIDGIHDSYQGFGQAIMNADRFGEDYPSIAAETTIQPVLVTEAFNIRIELVRPSFEEHGVALFDTASMGWLIPPER
jgi:hypothetical protein